MSKKRRNICIIGVGNIGSRHLQAIKKIKSPLTIFAVDPSKKSHQIAKERYNSISSKSSHTLTISKSPNSLPQNIDIAIIATNSNVRAKVIENLLSKSKVKYLILEKLLFQKRKDYKKINKLLEIKKCKAYVNCARRTQDFYINLKKEFLDKNLTLQVTGSNYGLVTSSIHFIDYIAYLTNCYEFSLNCSGLNPKVIPSKRKGFIELSGTLVANFANGSTGIFTSFDNGDAPLLLEIHSNNRHLISNETEKVSMTAQSPKWNLEKKNVTLPFQSELTNKIVVNLLKQGRCNLTTYEKSANIHLTLLEGLKKYLNSHSKKKYINYPFT